MQKPASCLHAELGVGIGSLGTGKPPPKMSESSPSAEDRRILLVKPS